jgi:hypothetical protein
MKSHSTLLSVVATVIATIAVVAVMASPPWRQAASQTESPPAPDRTALMAKVAERVERIRGQEFDHLPTLAILPADEIIARLGAVGSASDIPPPAKSAATRSLLALTGIEPTEITGGTLPAGLYVPKQDTIFIPAEVAEHPPVPLDQLLAHELTHALEEQRFGLDDAGLDDSEAADAVRALDEGSASFVETLYAARYLHGTPSSTELLSEQYGNEHNDRLTRVQLGRVALPYLLGVRFVAGLYARDGWHLVNLAFRHPPVTTAEVAHPHLWLNGDQHIVPSLLVPYRTKRWRFLGTGHFGEIDANLLLLTAVDADQARRATTGLEDGRYGVWRDRRAPPHCEAPCADHTVVTIALRFRSLAAVRRFGHSSAAVLEDVLGAHYIRRYLWRTDEGYAGAIETTGNDPDGDPTWVLTLAPRRNVALRTAYATWDHARNSGRRFVWVFAPAAHER